MNLYTIFTLSLYPNLIDRRGKAERSFLWQRRYKRTLLRVSLRTKEQHVAAERSSSLDSIFLQLKSLDLPAQVVRAGLISARDKIILDSIIGNFSPPTLPPPLPMPAGRISAPIPAPVPVMPDAKLIDEVPLPILSEVLGEWIDDMRSEWAPRTEKLNRRIATNFINWCGDISINKVTKKHVSGYKTFLEKKYAAPRTRQDALIKASGIFSFAMNKREYIQKNPFSGMYYKNVDGVKEKQAVTKDEHQRVIKSITDTELIWLLQILWFTGMRIGEVLQLRESDYRILEGIPCISVNTDDGKTLKTQSSIRDIPIHETLIGIGIMDVKPTFHWKKSNSAGERIRDAFKSIGLSKTAHCYRYGLSDRLRELDDVQDNIRFSILGHSHKITTDRVYRNKQPIVQMKKAIDRT